jgi:hypothetical protein
VPALVLGDGGGAAQSAREHKADAALAQDVGRVIARARLQAGVRDELEAEGPRVEERRLLGVAHEELDVVDAVERHVVLGLLRGGGGLNGGLGRRHGLSSVGASPATE